jgi:hypothetical protein
MMGGTLRAREPESERLLLFSLTFYVLGYIEKV